MRLFVGLALPDNIRARLSALKGGLKDARWVAPENLHLSLRFIGEVAGLPSPKRSLGSAQAGGTVDDIDQALQTVSAKTFALSLSGLGAFDRRGRVHAIWAGVEKSDALARLRDSVESALVRSGLEPEHRKFTPHVTVVRMKKGSASEAGQFLEVHHGFSAGPMTIRHFTLFESHLGHGGAHYVALADYPLEG